MFTDCFAKEMELLRALANLARVKLVSCAVGMDVPRGEGRWYLSGEEGLLFSSKELDAFDCLDLFFLFGVCNCRSEGRLLMSR